jgi:hypothetical protein
LARKDWVHIDRGEKFTIPAGKQRFSIVVIIDIPASASAGNYSGGIRLTPLELKDINTGTAINVSTFIQINFKIGNVQIFDKQDVVISENFDNKKFFSQKIILVFSLLFIMLLTSILGLYLKKKKNIKI